MATPTEILANNTQHPPAVWMAEYIRALAKVEEKAYNEREATEGRNYLDLVDRCREEEEAFFGPGFDYDDPTPPALSALREELIAETQRLSIFLGDPDCHCRYCQEEKEQAVRTRNKPQCAAYNLRAVAATLCMPKS